MGFNSGFKGLKIAQIYLRNIIFESLYRFGYLPMHHMNNDFNLLSTVKDIPKRRSSSVQTVLCNKTGHETRLEYVVMEGHGA